MNAQSEVRHGLRIDWNVAIEMDDGVMLRADVFRPVAAGRYPVLLSYGPYAKGLDFKEAYAPMWQHLVSQHPEVAEGTSTDFVNWETADPEKWVPHGYVCIRVDSRGAGQSPGFIDPFSSREAQDHYQCIEWAGVQDWSNGRVGLAGISYFAMNQWAVAALKPPHLKAICPFEGAADHYRDVARHGGIMCTFLPKWFPIQVSSVQNGLGSRAKFNPNTGESVAGEAELTDDQLAENRADVCSSMRANRLDGPYYKDRSAALPDIEVPVLSCANWGGQGLHLRGNIEGFLNAGSDQKWLEVHGRAHWVEFYTDYGIALQREFFDHFLKGEDNGWDSRAPVLLQVRHVDGFVERQETEWPLARTKWTRIYLDAKNLSLTPEAPPDEASVTFKALDEAITFMSEPMARETEITGPMASKLFAASSTSDADLFLAFRVFDPDDKEVLFYGAVDPNAPISLGWLRASQRKLNHERSEPYRPYHVHDESEPLEPGRPYELDVEIWPSCIVVPKGYRIALTISGRDYDHGLPEPMPQIYGISQRGVSVMLHDDPVDRPKAIFGGETTIFTGGKTPASILLPIIPEP